MAESGAAPGGPLAPLIAFARDLRARGLPVGTGRILTFCRAVAALGLVDREALYWAGRTSMIARKEDIEAYDEAFDAWYRSMGAGGELTIELTIPGGPDDAEPEFGEQPMDIEVTVGSIAAEWHGMGDDDEDEEEPDEEASIRIVASGAEVLREKSFADLSDEERAPHVEDRAASGGRSAPRVSRSSAPGARGSPGDARSC